MARTSAKLVKAICLWLDDDSDRDNPRWVVSRDELNEAGEAVTTETLVSWDDLQMAQAHARQYGRQYDLPVYEMPPDGPAQLVQPATTAEE